MHYNLIDRDPGKGYLDRWLWLPKSKISIDTVKRGLAVSVNGEEQLRLWEDAPHHLGVPRARLDPNDLDYEVIDLRPTSFARAGFKSLITLDKTIPTKDDQEQAFSDFEPAPGGILNLSCGKGKTVLCLHAVASWNEPALIICNTNLLMKQWKGAIEQFLRMEDSSPVEVGWIQGNPKKWSWNRPIVIASLKTLAMYHDQAPPEMLIHFGRIIWDEIHHLSAKEFSKTASLFPGKRYGASATTSRADGTEFVYYWHVGAEVHSNLEQDVIPNVLFRKSPTTVNLCHPDATDKNGQTHIRKLCRHVGVQERELEFALKLVNGAIDNGRNVVAISMSKDHARALHERLPGSGILDADVPVDDRFRMLKECQVCFGTVDMLAEALDKAELDSLIILTEFSSHNRAQQAVGRIQRFLPGVEKKAKVIVVWHTNVPPMKRMGAKLMAYFKQCGFRVRVK